MPLRGPAVGTFRSGWRTREFDALRLGRSEGQNALPAALEQRMATIDEPSLFDIGHRLPYKVKVRAKADVARGWLLYFIPWEVSTRWRQVRVETPQSEAARETR